ncbi:MAG TPA: hypothetical protein VFY27_04635, partial [Woeseiaceae bacterium]|nr:hypothetical protein [Woeseiaceae bacterium]
MNRTVAGRIHTQPALSLPEQKICRPLLFPMIALTHVLHITGAGQEPLQALELSVIAFLQRI